MYKNVLVPLDGSELAECGIEHAKDIARRDKEATITLFRAIEPLSAQAVSALVEAGDDVLGKVEREAKEDAYNYIATTESNFKAAGLKVKSVVVEGKAADEILDYAKKNDVDLIVMSTHGRSGVSRFFFGSVAEKVARHSTAPVLLISPTGCRVPEETPA
jgi:nucleotide-binding universal stress UspA family protein